MNNCLKILKDLIAIDSQCVNSNGKIVDYLSEKFNKFEVKKYSYNKENLKLHNLIVRITGKSPKNPLVFVGHTDTVPIPKDNKENQLKPIEKDGKIYGLGSSDMKSGLACMIDAVLNLENQPENDIYLIFDADEEGSGTGGHEVLKKLSLKDANVIICEPTDRKIIYAQKGCLDIKITTFGKAIHSSSTNFQNNIKNNAVYKAIAISNSLIDYGSDIEKKEDKLLGRPSFNIGQINGGNAANVVPAECSLVISRRLLPGEDIDKEFVKIKSIVLGKYPESKVEIIFYGEPYKTDENSKLIDKIKNKSQKFFGKSVLDVKTAWTEAALFAKYGEAIIFGPGNTEMAHKPDEYVEIEDLDKFTDIYRELMAGK